MRIKQSEKETRPNRPKCTHRDFSVTDRPMDELTEEPMDGQTVSWYILKVMVTISVSTTGFRKESMKEPLVALHDNSNVIILEKVEVS